MSFNSMTLLFSFIGGLGMFLYGMTLMSDGLQKRSGEKLKSLLNILTKNRFVGVLVGALITAIIQSSSATTVMVVGFVNSGLMNLTQAVGVIMGANIGTTITAWIVSLNQIGSFLKPEALAPIVLGIGAFFVVFIKDRNKKDLGEILIGLALIFIGLNFMSTAMKPLSQMPEFIDLFRTFGNFPILAVLVGLGVTALIQSSSASVGILQTLTSTGAIGFGAAAYITLGQNIGTCVTALLSSSGANRVAKRAAIIHLLFNIVGTIVFAAIMFVVFNFINPALGSKTTDSVQISIFHTIFNITNTLVLFPFAKILVKISEWIIPIKTDEEIEVDDVGITKKHLDIRLLETPLTALNVVRDEIKHLAKVVEKNLARVKTIIESDDMDKANKIIRKEKEINSMTVIITQYLVEISKLSLNNTQRLYIDDLLYTVSDIERVADHCENIAEIIIEKVNNKREFSKEAQEELVMIMDLARSSYLSAIEARINDNNDAAIQSIKAEQKIDILEEMYKKSHLNRMSENNCDAQTGVYFMDIISNLERISDHSSNISGYVQSEHYTN